MTKSIDQRFLTFSIKEKKELLKAWLLISLMFGIAFGGIGKQLLITLPIAILTAGIGFCLHEVAHKFFAQKYKCWAEFRANNQALIMGVLVSFFGFIIAAPGGVFIEGRISKRQHGIIGLAGPTTNLILGALFAGLSMLSLPSLLNMMFLFGWQVNIWLGLFNMIPVRPFDGRNVWKWNKGVWLGTLLLGLVIGFVPMALH